MLPKLDPETRSEYLRHMGKNLTSVPDFLQFIQKKINTLDDEQVPPDSYKHLLKQSWQQKPYQKPTVSKPQPSQTIQPAAKSTSLKCPACDKAHYALSCEQFTKLDIVGRRNLIKTKRLCFNCMQPNHATAQCSSGTCRKCNQKHHTLLHLPSTTAVCLDDNYNNFLSTAMVPILDSKGTIHKVRAVLDTGSTANLMTKATATRLGLPIAKSVQQLTTLGNRLSVLGQTKFTIAIPAEPMQLSAGVVDTILPHNVPQEPITDKYCEHLQSLQLADEQFNSPLPVDLLLSNAVYYTILRPHRIQGPDDTPDAWDSKLGFIVTPSTSHAAQTPTNQPAATSQPHGKSTGKFHCTPASTVPQNLPNLRANSRGSSCFPSKLSPTLPEAEPFRAAVNPGSARCTAPSTAHPIRVTPIDSLPMPGEDSAKSKKLRPADIEKSFAQLWDLEHPPSSTNITPEEAFCETMFQETTVRKTDGSFTVTLPMSDKPLADTKQLAYRRLQSLEKKFQKDPHLEQAYKEQIEEYIRLDHLEEAPPTTNQKFYLPHHAVYKNSSTSTKMRIVFDASASAKNMHSLNSAMKNGPRQQEDLWTILARFRKHPYALTADISQMYRQIHIAEHQWDLQRMLWRASPDLPAREYRLKRLTFGTKAAPFLATRVLRQLAEDSKETVPDCANILAHDFYVDDLMTGACSAEEAMNLQTKLSDLLASGGFALAKWASNSPYVQTDNNNLVHIQDTAFVSTLGLHWEPDEDVFKFTYTPREEQTITKRIVLSQAAQLFDPLGWLGPVTIYAKMFLQELWKKQIPWDQPLPQHCQAEWLTYQSSLQTLPDIKIPRHLRSTPNSAITICGFADASEKAYAATVYLRSINEDGSIHSNLIAGKTKVAPLKTTSIPRLELQAALLLANLVQDVKKALQYEEATTLLFTDSEIALAWLRSPSYNWHTFVANRVAAIQENSKIEDWHHVPSGDNPADCASRSLPASELRYFSLWWEGPQWLCQEPIPIPNEPAPTRVPELKISLLTTTPAPALCEKFSDLVKFVKVYAWVRRVAKKARRQETPLGPITPEEYDSALTHAVRVEQRRHFGKDVSCLEKNKSLPPSSTLRQLVPFLDADGLLRITGRLVNAETTSDAKHPLILPSNSHLTSLLVKWYHQQNHHAAPSLLLALLRTRFWILGGKRAIKSITRSCVTCHRYKAAVQQQLMGHLPPARVTPSRPFSSVGIDFAGPVLTKPDHKRTPKRNKSYIAVFVCMATKAIHLEVVSDLSTAAFLAAFRRFCARRGTPAEAFTDNATNFVGADNELQEFLVCLQSELPPHLVTQSIKWQFIPPHAPNFGGLWEAGVKSVKFHLRRVSSMAVFTFEELTTILLSIEACLNSRPLCPQSDDPEDFAPLTPGHFLIGAPLKAPPQLLLSDVKLNRLDRWQLTQRATQDFWKRWQLEYLNTLQNRPKTRHPVCDLQVNDLVLLREDNQPPQCWRLGRISETFPGPDGKARVFMVKTSTGTVKRAISKLAPLPLEKPEPPATPDVTTVATANPDVTPVATATPNVVQVANVTNALVSPVATNPKVASSVRSPSQAVNSTSQAAKPNHKKDERDKSPCQAVKQKEGRKEVQFQTNSNPRRSQRQRKEPARLKM